MKQNDTKCKYEWEGNLFDETELCVGSHSVKTRRSRDSDSPAVSVKSYLIGVSSVIYQWPLWLYISLTLYAIICCLTMDVLREGVQTMAASKTVIAVNYEFLNHSISIMANLLSSQLKDKKRKKQWAEMRKRTCGLYQHDTTFESL